MIATTENGPVHQVTGFEASKQKEEEDTRIVEENPEQTGEDYIKAQQNLPDVIVVGGDRRRRRQRGGTVSRLASSRSVGDRSSRRRRPQRQTVHEPSRRRAPSCVAQRDRLLEKFTVMQADLGGAFYEMAIRDHVRLDVLTRKAAELQRVDAELLAVERVLELERADAAGLCPGCGAPYGHAVRFCAQCGHALVPTEPAR